MLPAIALLVILSGLIGRVASQESHKVTFTNNCGKGTPKLVKGPDVLSEGQDYASDGALESAIIYLDDGSNGACSLDGLQCSMVEITLKNGANGASSSADISLIPDHKFSDPIGFEYQGGCDGQGAYCGEDGCNTAYYVSNDDCVVVGCPEDNVGIHVIFCNVQTKFTDAGHLTSPCHADSSNSTSSADGSSAGGQSTTTGTTTTTSSPGGQSTATTTTTTNGSP